ncbi:MAG: hypothetical protein H0X66_21900 [Verrucomicrobia bacterium]|nr:hypothetical protein [Verrucomicrobiota bacterium]
MRSISRSTRDYQAGLQNLNAAILPYPLRLTLRAQPRSVFYAISPGKNHTPVETASQCKLSNNTVFDYLFPMSTVHEIEAAIPKLSRAELEQFRTWFEDYLEDHLDLTDEVKAKLDESRREIAEDNFTTRQPK